MNPFSFAITDFGLTAEHQGQQADLYVALNLAASLYVSGYSGGPDFRAYSYVIDWFKARYGAQHRFVEHLAMTFNGKAKR